MLRPAFKAKKTLTGCARLRGRGSATRGLSNTTQGQGSSLRNTGSNQPDLESIGVPPTNFSRPTLTALNFWWRLAKFSLIGIAVFAGGTFAAFGGVHYWVEHKELAAPSDPDGELEKWGWLKDAERWTGGAKGGTDPALGRAGRYALRSAWTAQNWGTGTQIISSNMLSKAQQSRDKAFEASLEYAHDFYSLALTAALKNEAAGKPLRPETITELLTKKAATLERIGSKGALYDARDTYERVWNRHLDLGSEPDERARLALKLGDVSARLGDTEEARIWWAQALRLVSSADDSASQSASDTVTTLDNPRTLLRVPERLPDSPHAQRTLAATLSSLSAYYAQSGQLTDARSVQDAGIALLAPSVPANRTSKSSELANQQKTNAHNMDVSSGNSAPQVLHELYLQHRLSLLALHRAEVNHALGSLTQTLEELAKAATEAEDVVFALTSSPPSSPASSSSTALDTPAHKALLDDSYAQNRTLKAPASGLLRDARRTALHAWTLSGILHENAASSSSSSPTSPSPSPSSWKNILPSPSSSKRSSEQEKAIEAEQRAALRCYSRALAWAGVTSLDSESAAGAGNEVAVSSPSSLSSRAVEPEPVPSPSPSREMLPGEWNVLWKGYVRTREAVLVSAASGTVAAARGTKNEGSNEKRD